MKLLLDQNISHRLTDHFQNHSVEIKHLIHVGLLNADDKSIWEYAKKEGFSVVTFDRDFYELQIVNGFPPKIIWLRFGNTTRSELVKFFTKNLDTISSFLQAEDMVDVGCLEFS